MEKFFDENNIPDNHLEFFNNILKDLRSKNIAGAFFCGFPFLELSEDIKKIPIRGLIICKNGLFMFYENDEEKKLYRRHINKVMMNGDNISELIINKPTILKFFKINDEKTKIITSIIESDKDLSDEIVRESISIIQNILKLNPKDNRNITNDNSIGAKIVRRSKVEANFDEHQFKLIYQENDNHMRVRGLAGSGKTILLVKKMAYLHFKYPEMDLAYIFFTKSLKQSIDDFFNRFYKEIDVYGGKPNMDKIHIMHGWGNARNPGLYSTICSELGYLNEPYSPGNDLNKICTSLLEKINAENKVKDVKIFDYILIDEAQDFSLSFFKLAFLSLKPFGKFIYAYDELQTLNEYRTKMPEPKEILGDGEVCIDKNLPICYRSPKEIIVTAHALGLGIYHKDKQGNTEFCNVIEDKSIWNAIGYKILDGDIDYGHYVKLGRDEIIKNEIDDIIISEKINIEQQNEKVVKEIIRLISEEDVAPEDILIIDLDTISLNENFASFCDFAFEYMKEKNYLDENGKRLFELNLVNKESSYSFKMKGSISYTTIFRAKGNESNIVFILNSGKMISQISSSRNKLFTAMTRAKFKVYLYGIGAGMDSIVNEIESVKENDYTLSFIHPTKEDMRKYKDRFYKESKRVTKFESIFNNNDMISENDKKELIKMIVEQFGAKEVSTILKDYENSDDN